MLYGHSWLSRERKRASIVRRPRESACGTSGEKKANSHEGGWLFEESGVQSTSSGFSSVEGSAERVPSVMFSATVPLQTEPLCQVT